MISWLATKLFLQKAALWCKKYWQILLGAAIPTIIYVVSSGKNRQLKEVLAKTKEAHQNDVDALETAHQAQLEIKRQEIEAKELAAVTLTNRISAIEAEYNVSRHDLSSRKKKELDRLLSEDNKVEEVSTGLANIFGIDVKS
jgi:hypothetical protein